MRNYIKIFSLSLALIVFLSCDKEPNPMFPQGLSDNELINLYFPGDPQLYEDSLTFGDNTNTNRNVLIEDYTGHLCNNCPPAAITAKGLEDANPGRVSVLSVHAGGAGNTFQTVTGIFATDYTTDFGTDYTVDIAGFFGNPSGLVNRTLASGNTDLWIKQGSWGAQVNDLLTANDLKVNIQIQAEYYPATRGVFVHYEVEALEDLGPEVKVLVFVAEHKVISPQKLEDSSTDELYEHHNVLSGNLTKSGYGDVLNPEGLLTGEKTSGLVINGLDEMNDRRTIIEDGGDDLVVFALVVNSTTLEVLQVVEQDVQIDKQL